jgi:endonuclease/exonuclease/phosphatase (EEP) superfamily protein YafD
VSSLYGIAEQKRHTSGARRYWWIWILVAPVVAWTLIRLFGLDRGFPLVPLMAFTPYAAAAALLVAGVAVALRNWAAAAVACLATLCLALAVLPRAVGDGTVDPDGRETLSVLSANVYFGKADAAALVAMVDRYDVDLLSVQELTPSFVRELRRAGLAQRLPNAVVETQPMAGGGGLYSRLPLRRIGGGRLFSFRQPRAVLRTPRPRRQRPPLPARPRRRRGLE